MLTPKGALNNILASVALQAEDPVCGSGHCHIIPYWADLLGKDELVAYQASRRGGTLYCRREGGRIFMAGKAALYSIDELFV